MSICRHFGFLTPLIYGLCSKVFFPTFSLPKKSTSSLFLRKKSLQNAPFPWCTAPIYLVFSSFLICLADAFEEVPRSVFMLGKQLDTKKECVGMAGLWSVALTCHQQHSCPVSHEQAAHLQHSRHFVPYLAF